MIVENNKTVIFPLFSIGDIFWQLLSNKPTEFRVVEINCIVKEDSTYNHTKYSIRTEGGWSEGIFESELKKLARTKEELKNKLFQD